MTTTEVSWLGRPRADATALVILHGYGGNEGHLSQMLPLVSTFLPTLSAKVITVRGFHEIPGRPGGFSWFPGDVAVQPNAEEIAESADRLASAVEQHTDRAVWLGFSQGMCAAMTVLRRRPDLVTALVALSGFSWTQAQPGDPQLQAKLMQGNGTPAFYGRDPMDPRIPGFAATWALSFLRDHTQLTEREYPRMGHSISLPEILDVVAFLQPFLGEPISPLPS